MTCMCVTQWVIADQACLMYSMVTVALYDTLGAQAVAYVVNLCELISRYSVSSLSSLKSYFATVTLGCFAKNIIVS